MPHKEDHVVLKLFELPVEKHSLLEFSAHHHSVLGTEVVELVVLLDCEQVLV